jgi:hypothetical protein
MPISRFLREGDASLVLLSARHRQQKQPQEKLVSLRPRSFHPQPTADRSQALTGMQENQAIPRMPEKPFP